MTSQWLDQFCPSSSFHYLFAVDLSWLQMYSHCLSIKYTSYFIIGKCLTYKVLQVHILKQNLSNTKHDSRLNTKVCIGYFRSSNLQFLNHQKGRRHTILLWHWFYDASFFILSFLSYVFVHYIAYKEFSKIKKKL